LGPSFEDARMATSFESDSMAKIPH
jgi:hypothetical protein